MPLFFFYPRIFHILKESFRKKGGIAVIKEVKGDLLMADTYYIAHQVNCRGKMGAGVAYQIRRYLLGERGYNDYRAICRNKPPKQLLGANQYYPIKNGQVVVNMFGEDIPTGKGIDTDYDALRKCLLNLRIAMEEEHKDASIPGYLGCGLAGGSWDFVYTTMILPIFQKISQTLYIVYREDSILKLWREFQDVPYSNTGRLKESWHGFELFTDTFFIWKWFEDTFHVSVTEDLLKEKYDDMPLRLSEQS